MSSKKEIELERTRIIELIYSLGYRTFILRRSRRNKLSIWSIRLECWKSNTEKPVIPEIFPIPFEYFPNLENDITDLLNEYLPNILFEINTPDFSYLKKYI